MGNDKIVKLRDNIIQHGKMNDRIYLMKLDINDVPGIMADLDSLAETNGYTKIFAKVPENNMAVFLKNGYAKEAVIPGFFNGSKGCGFLAKYFSEDRKREKDKQEITNIIKTSIEKSKNIKKYIDHGYPLLKAKEEDAVELSEFYRRIFNTYPFPIGDPEYLKETMRSHIDYYLIRNQKKIIAASSAEIDHEAENAELTDFGTLPEYRGKSLASCLLAYMESEMAGKRIRTVYTIARALSYGMNITFSKKGYRFSGTLINNTNIAGQIESMNVWYKELK